MEKAANTIPVTGQSALCIRPAASPGLLDADLPLFAVRRDTQSTSDASPVGDVQNVQPAAEQSCARASVQEPGARHVCPSRVIAGRPFSSDPVSQPQQRQALQVRHASSICARYVSRPSSRGSARQPLSSLALFRGNIRAELNALAADVRQENSFLVRQDSSARSVRIGLSDVLVSSSTRAARSSIGSALGIGHSSTSTSLRTPARALL